MGKKAVNVKAGELILLDSTSVGHKTYFGGLLFKSLEWCRQNINYKEKIFKITYYIFEQQKSILIVGVSE